MEEMRDWQTGPRTTEGAFIAPLSSFVVHRYLLVCRHGLPHGPRGFRGVSTAAGAGHGTYVPTQAYSPPRARRLNEILCFVLPCHIVCSTVMPAGYTLSGVPRRFQAQTPRQVELLHHASR